MADGDKHVSLAGLKAVYDHLDGNISNLKSALYAVDNVSYPSEWTTSAFYNLSGSSTSVNIESPQTSGAGQFKCIAVPCKEGDVFYLTAGGGTTSARPYAFLSSASGENNIIKRASSTEYSPQNSKLIAPHRTAYAIFNAGVLYPSSLMMIAEDKTKLLTSLDIPFEIGNITFGETPVYTYDRFTRCRTPEGYSLQLHVGDIIGMKDYTDARFYVGWYDSENVFHSTTAKTSDYTVTQDGKYIFLLKNVVEASLVGNMDALTSLFSVRMNITADQIYTESVRTSTRNAENNQIGLNHPLFRLASPKMVMHRGYSSLAPENTIPAFELAGQNGAWGIETDIYETTDGYFYCSHDNDVERMTDGTGNITGMTSTQVDSLTIDAGSNIGEYTGLKIPRIEEYLAVCRRYGCVCVIEIKTVTNLGNLFSTIKSAGMENNTVILTQNYVRVPIYRFYTKAPIFLVGTSNTTPTDMVNEIYTYPNVGVDYSESAIASADPIVLAHSKNLPVIAWTVDNEQRADELFRLGVDVVTTNSIPVMGE